MNETIKRVIVEITHRCNLRCDFCYLFSSKYQIKKEINFNNIKKFIKNLKFKTEFYITGGEPLLYKEIIEFMRYIKSEGHSVGLNTNGTLLTKELSRMISDIEPEYIIFSLFSDASNYNLISNNKNIKFDELCKNIKYFNSIKSNKTESILGCVITKYNSAELYNIYELGKILSFDRVLFEHMQFHLDGEKDSGTFKTGKIIMKKVKNIDFPYDIYINQISKILADKSNIKFDIRPALSINKAKDYYNYIKKSKIHCDSCMNSIVIQPDGSIRLCILYSKKIGDIKRFNLSEVLKKKKELMKNPLIYCYRCCHRFNIARLKG
ncbi:MAG: radical SAM protein [Elusimicrobiales bacterium]|nr:radical SAM protein [Elusimicrobiales bacterium]